MAVEPNHDDEEEEADPRDSVFAQAENAGPNAGEEVRRTITMYRNGFVVDDGPYRRLDDPANADFLRSLAQGVTPRELMLDGDVSVGLIDKRQEDFQETFQSFSGAGASLGTAAAAGDSGNTVDPATLPESPPAVDASQPSTSIQVRTANGKRKIVKINLSSSVRDLAAHLRDVADGKPFRLMAGFPPKPIDDLNQSVEAAGLKGASVNMQSA